MLLRRGSKGGCSYDGKATSHIAEAKLRMDTAVMQSQNHILSR